MLRHYIYEVKEKFTSEFYWGSRSCKCDPKDDTYMGSMKSWKPNKENLVKTTIIEYNTRKEANNAEVKVIEFYIDKKKFPLNRNYHTCKNWSASGVKRSKETLHKMSMAAIGRIISEETRNLISIAQSKKKGELNQFYGHRHTEETKQRIGIKSAQRAGTRSIESLEKSRKSMLGKKASDETRLKMSLARQNYWKNKT